MKLEIAMSDGMKQVGFPTARGAEHVQRVVLRTARVRNMLCSGNCKLIRASGDVGFESKSGQ